MRIEDRIALGGVSETTLAELDHDAIVSAKTSGTQVCANGGDVLKEDGLYWFTLSTEHVNRRGDIIRQSGLDFRNWSKTPVVLHNHDDEFPVGLGTIRRGKSETRMGVQFSAVNPRAQMIRAMLDEGMPMASSIAIIPTRVSDPKGSERKALGLGPYGVIYEASEVIEGSVVTVPADPDAVRNCLRSAHVADDAEVERFVERMSATEMDLAKRLRVAPDPEKEPEGLESAIARLEASLDRAAARIEHAVRGGFKREPEGSNAPKPSASSGIDTASFLSGLTAEIRNARGAKDKQ